MSSSVFVPPDVVCERMRAHLAAIDAAYAGMRDLSTSLAFD